MLIRTEEVMVSVSSTHDAALVESQSQIESTGSGDLLSSKTDVASIVEATESLVLQVSSDKERDEPSGIEYDPSTDGYREPPRPASEIQQMPLPVPDGLEWDDINVMDDVQINELQAFLRDHYVEDDDETFRFNYTGKFLRWAMAPPGQFKNWNIALRNTSNKEIVGFVSAAPIKLRVRINAISVREYDFLCVHKGMRKKRLAPLLLKESERRGHIRGFFQAFWTSGTELSLPVSICQYYHRHLNPRKLVNIGFTELWEGGTIEQLEERDHIDDTLTFEDLGLRKMQDRDISEVTALYTSYMSRFDMVRECSEDDLYHFFLGGRNGRPVEHDEYTIGDNFMWAYVIEDPTTHKITDFFSFFSIPATVLNAADEDSQIMNSAYLAYYATSVAFNQGPDAENMLKDRLISLIGDAIVIAHRCDFDVFNAMTLMDNALLLEPLKFGGGNGFLKYYLDNWRTAPLSGVYPTGEVSQGRGVGVVIL